jgi:hypothetical protein
VEQGTAPKFRALYAVGVPELDGACVITATNLERRNRWSVREEKESNGSLQRLG